MDPPSAQALVLDSIVAANALVGRAAQGPSVRIDPAFSVRHVAGVRSHLVLTLLLRIRETQQGRREEKSNEEHNE